VSNVLYAVEIAVALGLIIFVHELGHFAAAKAFGVWVRRFAIGFGPVLLKWRRGETEYSLRAFPLGGFVEPMGDHPDSEGGDDPRALWRRPAWQRSVVFAAGVFMNGVLAIVFFTVASMIGISAPSPLVGDVTPMLPAEKAGIKAGDRIVAINGRPVESFEDVMTTVSSGAAGTAFDVTVERPSGGAAGPQRLTFEGIRSLRDPGDPAPRLGIEPAIEPFIFAMVPGVPEEQAGLKAGDRILEINGRRVTRWREMGKMFDEAPPGPLVVVVERDGKRLEIPVDPSKLTKPDLGMNPPVAVRAVDADGPAARAGIRRGDRIVRVDDVAWPAADQLSEKVKAAGDGGQVRLVLGRGGQQVEATSGVAAYAGHENKPLMGVSLEPAVGTPIEVGRVEPDGPAAKAGIEPGDVIVAMGADGTEPKDWDDVLAVFGRSPGKAVPLLVKRGGKELSTTFAAAMVPVEKFTLFGSRPRPILYEPLPRLYNPLKAVERGFKRTWSWFGRVYMNLIQLARGEVGREAVGGPVLIVYASLGVATRGLGTFIDFWGILSVCVAVFNFLPIPPFDGGHVLFVLLEKIKGSPIGIKVRTWVWGAGWAAVGVLFILITWQDIGRWVTSM
jgi:regulator of sigma E protease